MPAPKPVPNNQRNNNCQRNNESSSGRPQSMVDPVVYANSARHGQVEYEDRTNDSGHSAAGPEYRMPPLYGEEQTSNQNQTTTHLQTHSNKFPVKMHFLSRSKIILRDDVQNYSRTKQDTGKTCVEITRKKMSNATTERYFFVVTFFSFFFELLVCTDEAFWLCSVVTYGANEEEKMRVTEQGISFKILVKSLARRGSSYDVVCDCTSQQVCSYESWEYSHSLLFYRTMG